MIKKFYLTLLIFLISLTLMKFRKIMDILWCYTAIFH